ncbi:MAG: 50S ribosomal protein L18 [Alphaproteobacteria bacterium]
MFNNTITKKLYNRRKARTRLKLKKNNHSNRIRLSIFRSGKHIYGQFIDDLKGITIVSASSISKEIKDKLKTGSNIDAAKEVGYFLALKAKENAFDLDRIVFDKGGYLFHGRVKALVNAVVEKLS